MHPSTEDLLTLRDGEPLGVAARAALDADSATAPEVERLRGMQRALCNLPELPAPDRAWERVLAAEQTTRARSAALRRWSASAAVAATVAIAAVVYVGGSSRPAVDYGAAVSGVTAPSATGASRTEPLSEPLVHPSFVSLVEESGRLDRELAQISYQRPMMMGATASTIAGLEDRVALIDEQLSYGTVRGGLQPTQQQVLWHQRVDLMNALVQVRYAQAERTGF